MNETSGVIILFVVVASLVLWFGWKLCRLWSNIQFSSIKRRGRRGEANAIKLLKNQGFEIIESQVTLLGHLYVDASRLEFDIRPDYLVEHDGVQYLAEVKTGKAADIRNIATRRQLREYAQFWNTNTIILVNATKGTINKICF